MLSLGEDMLGDDALGGLDGDTGSFITIRQCLKLPS